MRRQAEMEFSVSYKINVEVRNPPLYDETTCTNYDVNQAHINPIQY